MRDNNFPMSSTMDNLAITDEEDYDSVEGLDEFESDFSNDVHHRLKSINTNLCDSKSSRVTTQLSDRKISNINASRIKTSDYDESLIATTTTTTTTEFQEISPELNFKHIRTYTSYHKSDLQKTSCDDSDESLNTLSGEKDHKEHPKEGRKVIDKNDLKQIHAELIMIHEKIVDEYKIFQEKQKVLIKRELKLKQDEDEFYKFNKFSFREKYDELKTNYEFEILSLRDELKEKTKEHKRLNESFKTIKLSNEALKTQLNEKQEKVVKLEKQVNSMTSRLANLQKLHETCICKPVSRVESNSATQNAQFDNKLRASMTQKSTGPLNQRQIFNTNILESLAISLDWINIACLKKSINFNLPINSDNQLVVEKSVKLMPTLAELLVYLNTNLNSLPASHLNSNTLNSCNLTLSVITKYHLTFLEFIYWSLLHFETSSANQKINLSATFRRIGEELYRLVFKTEIGTSSVTSMPADESTELATARSTPPLPQSFVFENNAKNQLLACLIILRTMNQVLLTWKNLLNMAIDVYLLMSVESKLLDAFLESCSSELWFSNIAVVLKNLSVQLNAPGAPFSSSVTSSSANLDIRLIEKMSVLLQKLSKIKSNKKYFEMFSLTKICTDIMHRLNHESEFLSMNLKSLIFNLKTNQHQPN